MSPKQNYTSTSASWAGGKETSCEITASQESFLSRNIEPPAISRSFLTAAQPDLTF